MRYALLSDVHANRPALDAVLAHLAGRPDVDAADHLGDLVGYSPWPNETVAAIRAAGIAGVHQPWHREVEGVHFVNTGSVGRPKDGDWRAGYVLLDGGDGLPLVEIVRVAYDVDAAAAGVRAAGLPEEFADFLRTGGRPVAAGTDA